MLETFTAKMTALADAVRSKFDITGDLTVADMVTAVSGQPYSSAGATLAGWDTDMHALGSAIRTKVGGTAELTVDQMTAAVEAMQLGYTSFTDPSLVESKYVGSSYNRITKILPAGTYSGLKIYGIRRIPSRIIFACNITGMPGTGGVTAAFTYSSADSTVTVTDTVPGGRMALWFNDGYDHDIDVSPNSNGSDNFTWSGNVTCAESSQTGAFSTVLASDSCLCITFDGYTPALTLMAMRPSSDAAEPDEEAEYLAYWESLKASAKESGGETK